MVAHVPVIFDIVGSRTLTDRAATQEHIIETFETIDAQITPIRPLWATVGDEFQAVYRTISDAIQATSLVHLLLTSGAELRCGIGHGEITQLPDPAGRGIDDGEGWYQARDALEELAERQGHGFPWLRTWATLSSAAKADESLIRSHLTMRDHVINRLKAKEKRITAGWLLGHTQKELSRVEKVSQSAISQTLRTSGGAALAHAHLILTEGDA